MLGGAVGPLLDETAGAGLLAEIGEFKGLRWPMAYYGLWLMA